MKNKILGIILITILMVIILPLTVMGYEDKDNVKNGNITYNLYQDGTAEIVLIEDDLINQKITIMDSVLYSDEEYKITSIGTNALSGLTQPQALYMYFETSPELKSGNAFNNVSAIYIPFEAQGYTEEAGWPVEKLKNYEIIEQPQDITVTAGEIKETDKVITRATIAVDSGSIQYNWYECDKDGKIENDMVISTDYDFKIPTDLTYDNENKSAKDYYFVCVVGSQGEILEKSRVVKVTVNPGTYKVYFNSGNLAEWTSGAAQNSIIVPVNRNNQLDESNIPSVEKLKTYGKGLTFIGWTIDEKNIVNPTEITFNKNTTLFPVWQYKVIFDANGGTFDDGKEEIVLTMTNYDYAIYDMIYDIIEKNKIPSRENYEYLGFFDEKTEGKSLEWYFLELGFDEERTFYAQWKEIQKVENSNTDINNEDNNSNVNSEKTIEETENPQTGDNIKMYIATLIVSGLGIGTILVCRKKAKRK